MIKAVITVYLTLFRPEMNLERQTMTGAFSVHVRPHCTSPKLVPGDGNLPMWPTDPIQLTKTQKIWLNPFDFTVCFGLGF